MNLPNKLTLLRMALVPVFVALLMAPGPAFQLAAALVFALASATDWFDGWYARRHHMVTDFGKLMDPMADKLLVMAALVGLLAQGRAPWLAVMVLLGREFIISGIRLVAAAKGEVIAAGLSGKLKTVSQMLGLILLPAKGGAVLYLIFFGLWPMIKSLMERLNGVEPGRYCRGMDLDALCRTLLQ